MTKNENKFRTLSERVSKEVYKYHLKLIKSF